MAELKRRINEIKLDIIEDWRYRLQREHDVEILKNNLYLINNLEVKEVDLGMKYIDAEKLKDKIKSLQCEQGFEDGEAERGYQLAIKNILDIIDSLQQEQPEMDLEKEFNNFLDNIEGVPRMWHSDEQIVWAKGIGKHFFEFGIRTRKEEVK